MEEDKKEVLLRLPSDYKDLPAPNLEVLPHNQAKQAKLEVSYRHDQERA